MSTIEITPIPGTPYISLTKDQNFTPKAVEARSIELETAIAELPEVQALKSGDVVFDVGALYGDTAVIFAKNGATVFAFEAQMDSGICLLWNAHRHPNIIPICMPVGNGETVACNEDPLEGNMGTRTVAKSATGVTSLKLDDISVPKLDLLKTDVEGQELFVLQGCEQHLRKFKPKLLIEIYHEMLERQGVKAQDIYDFLSELGYTWKVVIGSDEEPRFDILATCE